MDLRPGCRRQVLIQPAASEKGYMVEKSVTLYCRENGSDKVYKAEVAQREDGYTVTCWWGPRTGSMQTGTKTRNPVSKEEALKIWEKVVHEKKAKGYHEGEAAPAYTEEDGSTKDTGLRPMLLTPASESDVDQYLANPKWGAQEKLNGKRILVRAAAGTVAGANRRGLECAIPTAVMHALSRMSLTLDGEMVGSRYFAFDLIGHEGIDLRGLDYLERHGKLTEVLGPCVYPHVSVVPLALRAADKRALHEALKTKRAEGIVFKMLQGAAYAAGRSDSLAKATAVKVKFYASGEFVVLGWNPGRQSVALGAYRKDGTIAPVGNVTVPTKHVWEVEVNRVLQVRYLYATASDQLYQPSLDASSGSVRRVDKAPGDCLLDQLKYEGKDEE